MSQRVGSGRSSCFADRSVTAFQLHPVNPVILSLIGSCQNRNVCPPVKTQWTLERPRAGTRRPTFPATIPLAASKLLKAPGRTTGLVEVAMGFVPVSTALGCMQHSLTPKKRPIRFLSSSFPDHPMTRPFHRDFRFHSISDQPLDFFHICLTADRQTFCPLRFPCRFVLGETL